jgi:hypothetical protein
MKQQAFYFLAQLTVVSEDGGNKFHQNGCTGVGIVTGYRLEGRDSIPGRGKTSVFSIV